MKLPSYILEREITRDSEGKARGEERGKEAGLWLGRRPCCRLGVITYSASWAFANEVIRFVAKRRTVMMVLGLSEE
jgi:hypothetical protein